MPKKTETAMDHIREIALESGVDLESYHSHEKRHAYKGLVIESYYDEDSAGPWAWHAWTKGIGGSGGFLDRDDALEAMKKRIDDET